MMWRRQDADLVGAERLGGLDELLPLQAEGLAADDAGHVEPLGEADGDEDDDEAAAEEDDHQDDEEDEGQRVEDVDDAHHHVVDPPAEIARDRAVADAEHAAP